MNMKRIAPVSARTYFNLGISVLTGVLAQLLMKMGMKEIHGSLNASPSMFSSNIFVIFKVFAIVFSIFTNKYVDGGVALYLFSMFFWINVLSVMDLSAAIPFVSLGIVLTVILASVEFNESISLMRWFGIIVTLVGVYLVVSSQEKLKQDKSESVKL